MYPSAHLLGCSTAGEICGTQVSDDSLVVTAVHFEHTKLKGVKIKIDDMKNSCRTGQQLAQALDTEGLVHVFVLSDGLKVNGSELVKGLIKHIFPTTYPSQGDCPVTVTSLMKLTSCRMMKPRGISLPHWDFTAVVCTSVTPL